MGLGLASPLSIECSPSHPTSDGREILLRVGYPQGGIIPTLEDPALFVEAVCASKHRQGPDCGIPGCTTGLGWWDLTPMKLCKFSSLVVTFSPVNINAVIRWNGVRVDEVLLFLTGSWGLRHSFVSVFVLFSTYDAFLLDSTHSAQRDLQRTPISLLVPHPYPVTKSQLA